MLKGRTHPGDDLLLRLCDGELGSREADNVNAHIEACWECRTRLEDLKSTIGEFVHYRSEVLLPGLPPPPAAWKSLEGDFRRIRTEEANRRRAWIFLRRPATWILAGATGLLAAAVGRFLIAPQTSREPATPQRFERTRTVDVPPSAPKPPVVRNTTPAPQPSPSVGPDDELKVIAALHRAGADLGDPVDVRRTPERIIVTAAGLDPARLQGVRDALAGLSGVSVEIPADKPPSVNQSASADDTPASSQPSLLQERIPPADFPQFSRIVLEASEGMMARAFALRNLADRFPPSVAAELSTAGQRELTAIRQEHASALAEQIRRIDQSLRPILNASGNSIPAAAPPESQPDWQTLTQRLFPRAARTDRILAAIVAAPKSDSGGASSLSELAILIAELERDASSYSSFGAP